MRLGYCMRYRKNIAIRLWGGFILLGSFGFFTQALAQQIPVPSENVPIDSANTEAPQDLKKLMKDIEAEQNLDAGSFELEIDGLVVDETVTKAGRDFYQIFYSEWEPPSNAKNFTINISEKPARGLASILMIEINENIVIETPIQPRYDLVESMAQQAVQICFEYLLNYEQIQDQLSGEDLSGSGIF